MDRKLIAIIFLANFCNLHVYGSHNFPTPDLPPAWHILPSRFCEMMSFAPSENFSIYVNRIATASILNGEVPEMVWHGVRKKNNPGYTYFADGNGARDQISDQFIRYSGVPKIFKKVKALANQKFKIFGPSAYLRQIEADLLSPRGGGAYKLERVARADLSPLVLPMDQDITKVEANGRPTALTSVTGLILSEVADDLFDEDSQHVKGVMQFDRGTEFHVPSYDGYLLVRIEDLQQHVMLEVIGTSPRLYVIPGPRGEFPMKTNERFMPAIHVPVVLESVHISRGEPKDVPPRWW